MPAKRARIWQLWGWILFLLSALCFLFAGIRSGDPAGILGAAFFLVACLVFLVPLLRQISGGSDPDQG